MNPHERQIPSVECLALLCSLERDSRVGSPHVARIQTRGRSVAIEFVDVYGLRITMDVSLLATKRPYYRAGLKLGCSYRVHAGRGYHPAVEPICDVVLANETSFLVLLADLEYSPGEHQDSANFPK